MSNTRRATPFLCLIAFGIASIILADHHKTDEGLCGLTDDVSTPTYMYVSGAVRLGVGVIMMFLVCIGAIKSAANMITYGCTACFIFAWFIVGCVMFWHNCYHTYPHDLYIFFWVDLMFQVFAIAIPFCCHSNNDDN